MAEPDAGTQLTLLDTAEKVGESRLLNLYAYPENPQRSWVRSNFISRLADVIVVGAGTVRVENYGGAQLSAAARQGRRSRGQSEVPPIAIVTQSGRLDHDMKVFTKTEVPPVILMAER